MTGLGFSLTAADVGLCAGPSDSEEDEELDDDDDEEEEEDPDEEADDVDKVRAGGFLVLW